MAKFHATVQTILKNYVTTNSKLNIFWYTMHWHAPKLAKHFENCYNVTENGYTTMYLKAEWSE